MNLQQMQALATDYRYYQIVDYDNAWAEPKVKTGTIILRSSTGEILELDENGFAHPYTH